MSVSKSEQAYWDALERLKKKEANIVDTQSSRFKFTKDAVGREAGKGKGYVRPERYPELCEAIAAAEEQRKSLAPKVPSHETKLAHEKELKLKAQEKYNTLKKEYDLLMNDYLNILKQNFELQVQLSEDDDIQLVRDRKV